MSRRKIVEVRRADAVQYLDKASEFALEAQHALDAARHDAAMLGAVHAGISAADAVTVALAGRRSADSDHQRAADLLEEVGRNSSDIRRRVRQLRALLAKKNTVEYENKRTTGPEATDAVRRSVRLVAWARETVGRAQLS